MTDVPVFLITGFLEGGKTTFIKEIFNDPDFVEGEKITVIVCENGIEEYEKEFLEKNKVSLVHVNSKKNLTAEFLKECNDENNPTKVIVEYNGMWQGDVIGELELPENWEFAQIITPIDANTFESYMGNMKSLLIEQFQNSDLIIINRCKDNTDKLKFRNSIKAVNAHANIIFELENGEIDDRPLQLPFDINAKVIEFEDYDFGVWYLDATEAPDKYDGKHIKMRGLAYTNPKYPKNIFAFGRNAMTCCADDISFLGLLCQTNKPVDFKDKVWIEIEGIIRKQYIPQEQREIPFITIKDYRNINKLEDDLIYF
ncbi:putative repeat protein (TIGR03943 family) [Clostridium saccharoperbutylacetonicum]|uniref:Nucleotide-binding domain-containing protein CobW/HypB/UreG family n=1 Tax=Clostridium saccharoperbutylacetonicum N1-4(HMT) TaxID=931276 RepID=M1MN87_9CLOT|nr:GTP-binding protein [Clostridium saccharoperbutylacetonicum]AGF56186.1 nucleotide-binding domain-containing protein CobW/HypB/UreG family [Clostridium saccharoperbutylacetonicum N1-4(HMT)]NRT63073.1 putative repeat protein (TIGR03943 family) [Clostridium saccharoperbutylacetonicum]NSB26430.1 putative repeat protein (TIGR03943 family) [Clostridium saccharoperbutylacetonicum]NSB45783.1 putative repeat protein (TIGR03943 family) [Clostridium saccharoperbutylacetonicum]